MCYSTCSLNPMENEAVVAELLRASNGALRLVETAQLLPELARAAGLEHWSVVPKADGVVTASFEAARAAGQSQVGVLIMPLLTAKKLSFSCSFDRWLNWSGIQEHVPTVR